MREYLHKFAYHYDKKNDKSFLNVLYKVKKNRNNEIYKCPFYNVILNTNYKIQGWKIHISPFLDDYEKVLEIVIKKLVEEKVTFKFVPYLSDYLSLSDKNTSPSQFGKYITIYPHNVQQFKKLNSYFASVLLKFDGGEIDDWDF